jgi:hypothetical protein
VAVGEREKERERKRVNVSKSARILIFLKIFFKILSFNRFNRLIVHDFLPLNHISKKLIGNLMDHKSTHIKFSQKTRFLEENYNDPKSVQIGKIIKICFKVLFDGFQVK